MSKFKAGDRVYCPVLGVSIYRLAEFDSAGYPLVVDGKIALRPSGVRCHDEFVPVVFHATPENHALLSQLYPNVEFEKPKLTGSDLTRQMLADGETNILCWVADHDLPPDEKRCRIGVVVSFDGTYFDHDNGNVTRFATPIPRNYYAMDDSDE